jgi:hypothetical protein
VHPQALGALFLQYHAGGWVDVRLAKDRGDRVHRRLRVTFPRAIVLDLELPLEAGVRLLVQELVRDPEREGVPYLSTEGGDPRFSWNLPAELDPNEYPRGGPVVQQVRLQWIAKTAMEAVHSDRSIILPHLPQRSIQDYRTRGQDVGLCGAPVSSRSTEMGARQDRRRPRLPVRGPCLRAPDWVIGMMETSLVYVVHLVAP